MGEHGVDEDIQNMFKAAHHAIFYHDLAESQRAALQKYYAWNRGTWCREYHLLMSHAVGFGGADIQSRNGQSGGSRRLREEGGIAGSDGAGHEVGGIAGQTGSSLGSVSSSAVRKSCPPVSQLDPSSIIVKEPQQDEEGGRPQLLSDRNAGVANAAKPSACARCGGRARHDVAHCDKTHFAKPSCSAYETITRRDKDDGPLLFKDSGTLVCLNFNGGRACNNKGCPGHRCSLCGVSAHG
ncbi:hypothetical protein A4X06_0g9943, partial [Tilletia controversa]